MPVCTCLWNTKVTAVSHWRLRYLPRFSELGTFLTNDLLTQSYPIGVLCCVMAVVLEHDWRNTIIYHLFVILLARLLSFNTVTSKLECLYSNVLSFPAMHWTSLSDIFSLSSLSCNSCFQQPHFWFLEKIPLSHGVLLDHWSWHAKSFPPRSHWLFWHPTSPHLLFYIAIHNITIIVPVACSLHMQTVSLTDFSPSGCLLRYISYSSPQKSGAVWKLYAFPKT